MPARVCRTSRGLRTSGEKCESPGQQGVQTSPTPCPVHIQVGGEIIVARTSTEALDCSQTDSLNGAVLCFNDDAMDVSCVKSLDLATTYR